jgi:hypothetical protein
MKNNRQDSETKLVNKLAPFVTAEEVARADELEKELRRLNLQYLQIHPSELEKNLDTACAAYRSQPSDENLHIFKQAAVDAALVDRHIVPPVLVQTVAAVRENLEKQILAWARPILERGLTAARASLASVTDNERARHKTLTGELLSDSPIIAAARKPVTQLEALLATKTTSVMPVIELLKSHAITDARE